MFVYKFSVQGNLYLARYKQLKFRLQGKLCGKITTTNGSNCNLRFTKTFPTVCEFDSLRSQVSIAKLSQVTYSLLSVPYSCQFKWNITSYLSLIRYHSISPVSANCKFRYVTLKYKPLSGVIEHNFFLLVVEIAILSFAEYNQCSKTSMEASFHHKKPRFFSISQNNS